MIEVTTTLTAEEIEEIENALHESIQFYGENGQPANNIVVQQIRDVLLAKFGPRLS